MTATSFSYHAILKLPSLDQSGDYKLLKILESAYVLEGTKRRSGLKFLNYQGLLHALSLLIKLSFDSQNYKKIIIRSYFFLKIHSVSKFPFNLLQL